MVYPLALSGFTMTGTVHFLRKRLERFENNVETRLNVHTHRLNLIQFDVHTAQKAISKIQIRHAEHESEFQKTVQKQAEEIGKLSKK